MNYRDESAFRQVLRNRQSEQYDGDFPVGHGTKLMDFVKWINDRLEEVPSQWRGRATIEMDTTSGYEGECYANLSISYSRPETAEERAGRELEDRCRADAHRDEELRLLAQLQAKYK